MVFSRKFATRVVGKGGISYGRKHEGNGGGGKCLPQRKAQVYWEMDIGGEL